MNKPAITVPLLATTLLLALALALPPVTTAYPQVQPDGADYPAHSGENKCPFVCKAVYEPVCGSDGQTYDSVCELKLAQCDDDSLQVAYEGVCADDDDD